MLERQWHGVRGDEAIGESENCQHAERRTGGEIQRCRENGGAGALAADQRARNVKFVFGQQFVEVVAGDAAWNARELLTNEIRVAIANAREAGVDLPWSAAGANQALNLLGARATDGHPRAVVEHDVERLDIVDGFAAEQAVNAAAIVADHAAERAARMRRRIGRIGQMMQFGRVAQPVENDARLDRGELGGGIDGTERVHVAGKIEDDGNIGALAGEAGACAARKHRGSRGAAGGKSGLDVGGVARQNDADGKLAVVGRVGRVESAGAEIEENISPDAFFESGLKTSMRSKALMLELRLVRENRKSAHAGILARPSAIALASWPLLDDNPQIVELLDRVFEVTSHPGTIFCADPGSLGDRDHASILPRPGRQR